MQQAPADLRIDARLVVPMSAAELLLEHHSVLVRNGRILDVLPTAQAAERYHADLHFERPSHVLLPGLINGDADAAASLPRLRRVPGASDGSAASEQSVREGVRLAAARLIRTGTTCFADRYFFPDALARAAHEQGLRVHIGLPITDRASPWAQGFNEYLSRALALRDEFRDQPLVSTAFAPLDLSDAQFSRLATIADELDASLLVEAQRSAIDQARDGAAGERPLARLKRLGVLTPALIALHMTRWDAEDLALARDGGIALTLSSLESIGSGVLPPFAALIDAGIPFSLGSGDARFAQDIWAEMRVMALTLSDTYRALAAVTCDAAAVLGLGAQTGTLSAGRWADLCCLDIATLPALAPRDVLDALVLGARRELVSDVWVAGHSLLAEGVLTRHDWQHPLTTDPWRFQHAGNG